MATKSPKRLVLSGVSSVDNDQFPVLHGQERLNVGNSKARCLVFMLHHDPMNSPIRQQCQKFGALIVDATAAFFDDFADRPALRITPRDKPLGLRVEILFCSQSKTHGRTPRRAEVPGRDSLFDRPAPR